MTWLVVGLGNPGPTYAATRHNVGYLVADVLAARMGGAFKAHTSKRADVVEGRLAGERAVLGRSRSYMNDSGGAVSTLAKYYDVEPEQLIVVQDEIDLPFGSLRVKFGGGDNGHNGLRDIRSALGTGDYFRVRIGIGRPGGAQRRHRPRAQDLLARRAQGAPGLRRGGRRRRREPDDARPRGHPEPRSTGEHLHRRDRSPRWPRSPALVGSDPGVARFVDRDGVDELTLRGPEALRPFVAAALSRTGTVLVVTATAREGEDLVAELGDLIGADAVAFYPAWETLPHERLSPRSDTVGRRLAVLRRLVHADPLPLERRRRAGAIAAAAAGQGPGRPGSGVGLDR